MNYVTYQANDHDCGFVALKMLLAALSKNKSYLYLPKEGKTKNYSFNDLIKIAESYGVVLKAYQDEDKDLSFLQRNPALLLLDDEKTYNNHLVMVRRLKRHKVYFNDPIVGEVVMKEEEFLEKFSGKYLQVETNAIKPFQAKEVNVTHNTQLIPILLFNFLSMVFLLTGLYFVKTDEYVFIPLVFIALFSICELVENWYYINLLKQFDITYLNDYMLYSKDRVKDYKEYTDFKILTFNKARNISSACCMAVSIIVVLLINDKMNCFPILLFLALAVLDYIFTKTMFNKQKIAQEESSLLLRTKSEDLGDGLLRLNAETNKMSFNLSSKRCLIIFLTIFIAFAMMLINHLVSANYLLFNFATYYVMYEQFGRILSYNEHQTNFLKAKERFLEVITLSKGKQDVI